MASFKNFLEEAKGVFYHGTKSDIEGWIGDVRPETAHSSFDRLLGPHFSGTPDIANKFAMNNPGTEGNKGSKFGGRVYPVTIEGEVYALPQKSKKIGDSDSIALDALNVVKKINPDLFSSFVTEFRDNKIKGTIEVIQSMGSTPNKQKIIDGIDKVYFEDNDYGGLESLIRLTQLDSKYAIEILKTYKDYLISKGYGLIEYSNTGRYEKGGLKGDQLKSYIALGKTKSIFEDVFHGSPHVFEPDQSNPLGKFSSSKIGTSNGRNSYGYGLYFTSSKDVANWYSQTAQIDFKRFLHTHKPNDPKGKVYTVEIPEIDSFLRLDSPLSENPTKVQTILKNDRLLKAYVAEVNKQREILNKENPKRLEHPVLGKIARTETTVDSLIGSRVYQAITSALGSDKKASEYLLGLGIKGNVFSGEDGSNYVVFSDNDVYIKNVE